MSDEAPKTEAPPKDPLWVKVDPRLQRTAWTVTITVGVLTLISNYVVPYYQYFLVAPQFVIIAWYLYKWQTKKGYLAAWYNQHAFLLQAAFCLLEYSFYIKQTDGNVHIQNPAILWIVAGFSWFALSLLAAYEKDKAVWNAISDLADCIPMLGNTQSKLVDTQSKLSDNQYIMAKTQELMLTNNALDKRLAELQKEQAQREKAALAADTAKKRRPRADSPKNP